ncbi:hypothetical protein CPB84DRAFT_1759153 [Gymnopilus junonius]|uniref:Uncharacterized protein n=1 Tax=Gymnopilus junonius TaxID=109634 RepID=A0A9P5P2J5_GYMJU|nr:hypothetical protein CPB84DRAFT_1759153 [Gymnopilus junonius]
MPQQPYNHQTGGAGGTKEHANSENRQSESTGGQGDTYNNNHHGIFGGRQNTNKVINQEAFQAYDASLPLVPLKVFCDHYRLDQKVQARLEKMEFQPGDPIEDVDSWKEYGFQEISWNRVKAANQLFINQARAGMWKEYES